MNKRNENEFVIDFISLGVDCLLLFGCFRGYGLAGQPMAPPKGSEQEEQSTNTKRERSEDWWIYESIKLNGQPSSPAARQANSFIQSFLSSWRRKEDESGGVCFFSLPQQWRMNCCGLWLGTSPLRTTTPFQFNNWTFIPACLVEFVLLKRRQALRQ